MNISFNMNQLLSYALYLVLTAAIGYLGKELKAQKDNSNSLYNKLIQDKNALETKVANVIGQDNETKVKQIVKDKCIEVEQLAKESIIENTANSKHTKALELIEAALKKVNITVTDEEIYDLIKTTVGYMNQKK